jgi:hypothetical protein
MLSHPTRATPTIGVQIRTTSMSTVWRMGLRIDLLRKGDGLRGQNKIAAFIAQAIFASR